MLYRGNSIFFGTVYGRGGSECYMVLAMVCMVLVVMVLVMVLVSGHGGAGCVEVVIGVQKLGRGG